MAHLQGHLKGILVLCQDVLPVSLLLWVLGIKTSPVPPSRPASHVTFTLPGWQLLSSPWQGNLLVREHNPYGKDPLKLPGHLPGQKQVATR